MPTLPTLQALRYVQPLREGGSLPAVVDTDDGLYVVKFRGAGQGAKVLIAELIVGIWRGRWAWRYPISPSSRSRRSSVARSRIPRFRTSSEEATA